MKKIADISIVSPIYNDTRTLRQVLTTVNTLLSKRTSSYEIICIDDASTDDSVRIAKVCEKHMKHLKVFTHDTNQGIAKTYRELYKRANGKRVVLFSMDGEWNPNDVLRLLDEQNKTGKDIIIGCRMQKQYTPWRGLVSYMYNFLMNHLFGVQTRDAGSIKVFKKKVLSLPILSNGVFDEAERLLRASRAGYTIGYLPIDHYKKIKRKRGIRMSHVIEALFDMIRVYRTLRV